VSDGTVASNTATVTITIVPVNDAPVAANKSVSTNEDAAVSSTVSATDVEGDALTYTVVSNGTKGSAVITNASTGAFTDTPAISAGPADENGQALNFVVSNSNNALFSAQPAVAANGTLTFTPAANANGSATVTVQLHDNGGVANGGVDSSATQTFTITVTAVNGAPSFDKGANQSASQD